MTELSGTSPAAAKSERTRTKKNMKRTLRPVGMEERGGCCVVVVAGDADCGGADGAAAAGRNSSGCDDEEVEGANTSAGSLTVR